MKKNKKINKFNKIMSLINRIFKIKIMTTLKMMSNFIVLKVLNLKIKITFKNKRKIKVFNIKMIIKTFSKINYQIKKINMKVIFNTKMNKLKIILSRKRKILTFIKIKKKMS
jgi:hypothetical protein